MEATRTPPEVLERLLLSALQTADDLKTLRRINVTADSFSVAPYRDVFIYIERRLMETALPPSDNELQALYDFKPDKTATDVESLATTLRHQELIRKAHGLMQENMDELYYREPADAIQAILEGLADLQASSSEHVGYSDANALDRLLVLKERAARRARGELIGIPTGLPLFDDTGVGWQPSELITIMGRTGIGKSWLLLYFGCVAYHAGYRVLYISPEMSKEQAEFRMDSVLSHLYDYTLSNQAILRGDIDPTVYESWLGYLSEGHRWVTVDSTDTATGKFNIKDIAALVSAHKPDVLCLDGFHLLGGKDEQWKVISEAGKTLKGLAQRNGMVVITAAQVTREAMKTTGDAPDIQHGAYGKALMEDSDRLISIAQPRGQPKLRFLKIPKTRGGDLITIRVHLHFDVDVGDIRQISSDELRGEMGHDAD